MTTCFNSIDYWTFSQQKSLYEDIYSINLILWLKVIPQIQPECDKARVNSLIPTFWSHKLKLFSFTPFPSLHLLSSNTKQQSNVKALLVRSIYHHTLKSHVTTTGHWCFVTSYKIPFRNLDAVSQEGAHKTACSFGTWNAEHISGLDVHSQIKHLYYWRRALVTSSLFFHKRHQSTL